MSMPESIATYPVASAAIPDKALPQGWIKLHWKLAAPLVIWLVIYLAPVPAALNANQWHYFALFAAVIAALILESMPVGAVGLIGLTIAGGLGCVGAGPRK